MGTAGGIIGTAGRVIGAAGAFSRTAGLITGAAGTLSRTAGGITGVAGTSSRAADGFSGVANEPSRPGNGLSREDEDPPHTPRWNGGAVAAAIAELGRKENVPGDSAGDVSSITRSSASTGRGHSRLGGGRWRGNRGCGNFGSRHYDGSWLLVEPGARLKVGVMLETFGQMAVQPTVDPLESRAGEEQQ